MFVVTRGLVELRLPDSDAVEVVGPGGLFGQTALADSGPCAATATAISAAELVPLSRARFSSLVQNTSHFALELVRTTRRSRRMGEPNAGKHR
jgi:CRP-like cAMP-binding protein